MVSVSKFVVLLLLKLLTLLADLSILTVALTNFKYVPIPNSDTVEMLTD